MIDPIPLKPFLKSIKRNYLILIVATLLISSAVYLPFISHFGYYNDDWYLMYAAGAKGPAVFSEIYGIDRPLRAWVMSPAYILFGANPLYYNFSAFIFRCLSALGFLLSIRHLWPRQQVMTWIMALLFLIFPGFLSQFNGIDYQSQMVSLAAGMFSLALSLHAYHEQKTRLKIIWFTGAAILTWFYLGLVEYFIGLEIVKFACFFILIAREEKGWMKRLGKSVSRSLPLLAGFLPFLWWRLFFFESARGATDVELQFDLGAVMASPIKYLLVWSSTLLDDSLDVLFRAWGIPLRRLTAELPLMNLLVGFGITFIIQLVLWMSIKSLTKTDDHDPEEGIDWIREATILGSVVLIIGLLPVILVGRSVDFRSFSRYSLIAAAGAALIWPAALSWLGNINIRNFTVGLLVLSASLTHYANGFVFAQQTAAVQNFWWQVSWRIPEMDLGTTLVSHYFIIAEEDYFIWGPANLIYYPKSTNPRYVQPGVYAVLLNDDTIAKVQLRQPQEFSNRRGIRSYPNYRNILIITQPSTNSCVQVVDSNHVELSSREDTRIASIAPFSETQHIWLDVPFKQPPAIPFGSEPVHGWCYYYEKASFARQVGDWSEVARLGDDALAFGYSTGDAIEWVPFLQAYALSGNLARLEQIASFVETDPTAQEQSCHWLSRLQLTPEAANQVRSLFCVGS